LTQAVQDWVDGVRANNGVMLIPLEDPSLLINAYGSKESDISQRPFLRVTYQIEPPTPTPNFLSPNFLRNADFNIAPKMTGASWLDIGRVMQAPLISDPIPPLGPIGDMPGGSCGQFYWLMSKSGGTDGQIVQDFGWVG